MSLKVPKMWFMFSGDIPYPPPQRKREAVFRKIPGWPPDLMCTTPPGALQASERAEGCSERLRMVQGRFFTVPPKLVYYTKDSGLGCIHHQI